MLESAASYTLTTPLGNVVLDYTNPEESPAWVIPTSVSTSVDVRRQIDPYPRRDGVLVGNAYADGRVITITGSLVVPSHSRTERNEAWVDILGKVNRLMRADGTLRFTPAGYPEMEIAVRRFEDPQISGGVTKGVLISLIAPDPRIYTREAQAMTVAVDAATPFFTEFTDPIVVTVPEENYPENTGTADSYPVVTITGSITSPKVFNVTTNRYVYLPDLVLNEGETLTIDMQEKTVILSDSVSRYQFVDVVNSEFFPLAPGVNNIQLSGTNTSPATSATVVWKHAYFI